MAINDVVVELTGYSRDELIGASISRLLDEDDIQKATTAIRDLLTTDQSGVRKEFASVSTDP